MRRLFALLLMILPLSLLKAAPYTALQDGESFRYKAGWGIFSSAGEIFVSAKREMLEGKPVFRVTMTTSTKGVVSGFYSYQEKAEAMIDAETGRIIVATDEATTTEKMMDATTHFDYSVRKVTHKDPLRPGRNCEFAIPAGDPIDLISALIQTREWADKTGVKRDALVFAGRDVYPITISSEAVEKIRVGKKYQDALLLIPRMEGPEPRGIFKRGGEIKVWVAMQGERLPVKMQLKLKIGTATLTLVEHLVKGEPKAVASSGGAEKESDPAAQSFNSVKKK